jgi:hypothetical protein
VRILLAIIALGGAAHAETWHTYAAFRNDVFSELDPPFDDQGFTHDNVFSLVRREEDRGFGGRFVHRWITSNVDRRRWDQLEVVALADQALTLDAALPLRASFEERLGPTLGGDFGGQYLQNGWHELTGTGPTVYEGLANEYPGDRQFGVVVGGRARAQLGNDRVHGYAHVDGQLGLAAGVSSLETALGGTAGTRHVGLQLELAVTRYRVTDDNLGLPGGYGRGWNFEWRAGAYVAWSRFRVSYQYRANEGGSGEPIGVLAFQSVR